MRQGFKNKYHKNMCLKEIRVHVQNMIPILISIVNIIEGTYTVCPFDEQEDLQFENE